MFYFEKPSRGFEKVMQNILTGKLQPLSLLRIALTVNGKPIAEQVLNEVLVASSHPAATSRLDFEWGKRKLVHQQRQTQMTLAVRNVEAVGESVDLDARKAFLAYQQAEEMLQIANADGKPVEYRNFIRNQFTVREVVVSPLALTEDHVAGIHLAPGVQDAPDAVQDRRACCGTMNLYEYYDVEHILDGELHALSAWCADAGHSGAAHPEGSPGNGSSPVRAQKKSGKSASDAA